jgi:catechol 2,3-dioxygenase-like lactoylglutathione lyase family enzyme
MSRLAPAVRSVHETVLYAVDVLEAANFYASTLRMRLLPHADHNSAALRLRDGDAVLLIFNPEYAKRPGRNVPTHGTTGSGHIALRVDPGSLPAWKQHLDSIGVPIEMQRDWERGGTSIYVRDPADNSVELVEGDVWPS